jgi:hypothetical protein
MSNLDIKYSYIKEECLKNTSIDPIEIANDLMHGSLISPNGPEHHFLDGAAFLTAYKNAGGKIDLELALDNLASRSILMPGATCGYWGVCGASTSVGAAFSIINKTTPLSSNQYYKDNMEFTSKVLSVMSKISGPRCCKRNAYISLSNAVKFAKEKYGVEMKCSKIVCDFSLQNPDCTKEKCPFYKK